MEFLEPKIESHEQMIDRIVLKHFGESPKSVRRMTTGICNEVYDLDLGDREIIARLSPVDYFLEGTSKHVPLFRKLGIVVPEILAEDYSRTEVPYVYQFLSKLRGVDLGNVIADLSDEQLNGIAGHISEIIDKVQTLPASEKFGLIYGSYAELSDTWTDRMEMLVQEAEERGIQTGVMDKEMQEVLRAIYDESVPYFNQVKPVAYFGDMCSKNVMVDNGIFVGLVDLDGLVQGDPLESIGRIRASWPGTHYGDIYTEAVMEKQKLTFEQRRMVNAYALLNRISWACENGIQFNQNTSAMVDREKERRNKEIIRMLYANFRKTA